MPEQEDKMLTVPEVAKALRVTELTVRRWLWSGRLKARQASKRGVWRIAQSDLDTFLLDRT
jgi:excisionase family DNA binding protein